MSRKQPQPMPDFVRPAVPPPPPPPLNWPGAIPIRIVVGDLKKT